MKNIILSDNDFKQVIAKIYVDGSLRLVQRWKKERCQNQIFYLEPNQMKILKTEISNLLTEKYKVEFTKDEIRNLLYLTEFSFKKLRPFIPIELLRVERILRTILIDGCFKHNRIRVKFQINPSHSIVLCPKCNPKEYKELKKEYKEELI